MCCAVFLLLSGTPVFAQQVDTLPADTTRAVQMLERRPRKVRGRAECIMAGVSA